MKKQLTKDQRDKLYHFVKRTRRCKKEKPNMAKYYRQKFNK